MGQSVSALGRSCNPRWLIFSQLEMLARSAIKDPLNPKWLSYKSSLVPNATGVGTLRYLTYVGSEASFGDDVLLVDWWVAVTISVTLIPGSTPDDIFHSTSFYSIKISKKINSDRITDPVFSCFYFSLFLFPETLPTTYTVSFVGATAVDLLMHFYL